MLRSSANADLHDYSAMDHPLTHDAIYRVLTSIYRVVYLYPCYVYVMSMFTIIE